MLNEREMRAFLRQNWLGLLGLLVGVLGLGLSYYFYRESTERREPTFVVDPIRTALIDSAKLQSSAINITRANGSRVEGDVTAVRFFLWNAGRQPIREAHVLSPLRVMFDNPAVEVLEVRLLRASREAVVGAAHSVVPRGDGRGPGVGLSFRILDHGDGMAYQILFAGPRESQLRIAGAIEGVAAIRTNEAVAAARFWPSVFSVSLFILVPILGLAAISLLTDTFIPFLMRVRDTTSASATAFKDRWKHASARGALWLIAGLGFALLAVLAIMFIYGITFGAMNTVREMADKSVIREVPSAILPSQ
jgi:hypothetical protein